MFKAFRFSKVSNFWNLLFILLFVNQFFFRDLRLSILLKNYWTSVDKHAAMFKLTFSMMKSFSEKLIRSFYVLGLVQGNVTKETAISTSKMLMDVLKCEPLQPQNFPKVFFM